VCAYSGNAAVFYTKHHENGEVKEVEVIFRNKNRRNWEFRQDGSLESETTFSGSDTGRVQFYDTSGNPTGTAGATLRAVD
jgi:antitoxin component YwqK of YwqJK toxin-antitoxin module